MKRVLMLLLLVAFGAGGYWYVQGRRVEGGAKSAEAVAAIPVITQSAESRPVPEDIATIGAVQPIASIAIKARLDSIVDTVHFTEGQEVKSGDLLFTLDDRALQAQLRAAQANLERDRASLEKARQDVVRYDELLKRAAASRQQFDSAVATSNALEGTVKADQAAIESAKVALSYTRIYAPMDGRTGTVSAKAGASVRAADANALVTITQLRPINVAFSVAERYLGQMRQAMRDGRLVVSATIPNSKDSSNKNQHAEGELTFIDNQVDQRSGTILVYGTFANADTLLWPGQFVDAVLTLRVDPQALTLPAEAVQTGQEGRFVYVVKPDNKVEMRSVSVARTHKKLAVIGSGLSPGERVVVDGQSRLFPGAAVSERTQNSPGGNPVAGGASDLKPAQAGGPS